MLENQIGPSLRFSDSFNYWTGFIGEHYLGLAAFGSLRSHVENKLLAAGLPKAPTIKIREFNAQEVSPTDFRREIIKRGEPAVIRGLASSWPVLQKWTPEFFATAYGSEVLRVRRKGATVDIDCLNGIDVTMEQFVENMRNSGSMYASNLEDLFNHHHELRSDLEIDKLQTYSCGHSRSNHEIKKWRFPRWGEIVSTQLFMGNAKTRTGYHAEPGSSFFVQIHGRKRWTFVNPRYTVFMSAALRNDSYFGYSTVDTNKSKEELDADGHGLYNLVPKYEVVLEPGDVLFSPQWWWHTVDNLSPTIGVGARFLTTFFAGNPIYSVMHILAPTMWKQYLRIVRTGWGSDATLVREVFGLEGSKTRLQSLPRQTTWVRPGGRSKAAG